jgi:hypothetical protein
LARTYEDRVAFVGVAAFDEVDAMQEFVDRHDLDHIPHAVSEDGELFVHFGVSYQPAWVLLDAEGEVALRATRPSADDVVETLDGLADG